VVIFDPIIVYRQLSMQHIALPCLPESILENEEEVEKRVAVDDVGQRL
jgi:hypothetical protein